MSHYSFAAKTYRILISATTLGGAAPDDGFIDPKKVRDYVRDGDTDPTTAVQALAKARGNSRYNMMVMSIQQDFNAAVSNVIANGATSTAPATTLQFDLTVERGESVVFARDENNNGAPLSGIAAIKRLVARTLLVRRTDRLDYSDPTTSAVGSGQDNATATGARRGETIADVIVGRLTNSLSTAEAAITVTAL